MKLAIIGCGSIGKRHLNNLLEMKELELFAYDRDEDRLAELSGLSVQSSHKIVRLWEWKPDAVIICTPPDHHYRIALQALTKECHVFCEKPLATNYADAKRMTDEARARGKVLACGYQLRFTDLHLEFERWKWDRDLVITHYQDMSTWPSQYKKDMLEEFSHEIDTAVYFNGPVKALMAFRNGLGWQLELTHLHARSSMNLFAGNTLGIVRMVSGYKGGAGTGRWHFDQQDNDDAYKKELAQFIRACTDGIMGNQLCAAAEAAHVVRIIEACRESAKYHSVVRP